MPQILICPGERPAVAFLAQSLPLVGVPVLGESLLAHWMFHLASKGASDVLILATDRPEVVRFVVGDGSRWGLRAQVQSELNELTPEQAVSRFVTPEISLDQALQNVSVVDHLPAFKHLPLFKSYADYYKAALNWMPHVAGCGRPGLREQQEGIWLGRRTHVAPSARLIAPCWLGDYVRVGPNALIGPNTVLESGVVVESAAEISSSIVGQDTFVGKLVRIQDSIAWGNTLIHWQTGSCTIVTDAFLLCSLGQRYLPQRNGHSKRTFPQSVRAALLRSWGRFAGLGRGSRTSKSDSAAMEL
jgi:NDP-sugar pyrophosphorylase family protein